jgi:hypothetical protein
MYTLKDLFADVLKKRGPLTGPGKGVEDYAEVWDCYNRYNTALFNEKKGLNTTNFCKMGWVIERRRQTGKNVCRPYFQLAESFCRGFGVEAPKAPHIPEKDFCPFEELNFSKAAIKYSSKMTKDQMFSGLRYLVQGLGEAVGRGATVMLEFEQGRLLVQERKPRFAFDAKIYAREGIQAPADAVEDIQYAPSVTFAPPSEEALKLQLKGEAAGVEATPYVHPSAPEPAPVREEPMPAYDDFQYRREAGADVLGQQLDKGAPTYDHDEMSTVSGSYSMGETEAEDAANKQHFAYKEALERHITEMEIRASEAVKERQQWENHISRCLQQERQDFEKKRARENENQEYLTQQMRWNEEARHDQRRHMVEVASSHDFPHFSEPPEAQLKLAVHEQQGKFRGDLDFQVRTNNALREMSRQKERELENSQLEANRSELKNMRDAERLRQAADKSALTQSWDQEIRMKGIWKAIENHTNAAAHSQPLQAGVQPDFGSAGGDNRAMLRSSSGASSTSSRRMPGGMHMSLQARKEKEAREKALRNAGGAALSTK